MSSSNLAVRDEPTATDVLSNLPRPEFRVFAENERPESSSRPRTSLAHRKIVTRDHGLPLFRVR